MGAYKQQEFDFINRTKEIIKQYDDIDVPENEKRDTTLLLNCMVGLLILPQQKWFNDLPTDLVTKEDWGIDESEIKVIKNGGLKPQKKSVKNVAKHLRNAIAHYHFVALADNKNEISGIHFKDYKVENKVKYKTFDVKISIENLRKFTDKFTSVLLEKMDKSK